MQFSYRYGGREGRAFDLTYSRDLVAVRAREAQSVEEASLSARGREELANLERRARFQRSGVEVYQTRPGVGEAGRDRARRIFKDERAVRFAGRVLTDPSVAEAPPELKDPVIYTENLFVKFSESVSATAARRLLRGNDLKIKRQIEYVKNGYFVAAREGIGGEALFGLSAKMLGDSKIELLHPELVRERAHRSVSPFPQQWHLARTRVSRRSINAHANVAKAWERSKGEKVTIAVIDDGFDIDHEEFTSARKISHPRDVARENEDPRPGNWDDHGTPCAGVACADGRKGATGVAPRARLMPIRLCGALGSQDEADAIAWAADHGAGVISCSWGPVDGDWWNPHDPRHDLVHPLPDSTRLAIEYALEKGCSIVWAAGNGNESVDYDGYASHPGVVAVAACNDRSERSVYSDYGDAIFCSFPSDDSPHEGRSEPLTPGIWTTDRQGAAGYNCGGKDAPGDPLGNYTNSFGGTSSAAPGVAGVIALMLSRHPKLGPGEIKSILRYSCDQIDNEAGDYGQNGHSVYYGFGRVNAELALDEADYQVQKKRAGEDVAPPEDRPRNWRSILHPKKKRRRRVSRAK